MATSDVGGDKYRSYLSPEELKTTQWNDGPPNYDVANTFFEQGRTKMWAAGSLGEYAQNLVKTWEMELLHKANPDDYKTCHKKFVLGVNGSFLYDEIDLEEAKKVGGGYNVYLQTSLPPRLRLYDPEEETYDSSLTAFKREFPRGFALEVVQVYSGPPVIAYKYRHWGYMEGSYKEYPATGVLIEVFGITIFELNEEPKLVKVEFFHDRRELLASLIKGEPSDESTGVAPPSACPFMA